MGCVEAERRCEILGVLAAQMRQKYASIISQHIIDFTSLYMGQCMPLSPRLSYLAGIHKLLSVAFTHTDTHLYD